MQGGIIMAWKDLLSTRPSPDARKTGPGYAFTGAQLVSRKEKSTRSKLDQVKSERHPKASKADDIWNRGIHDGAWSLVQKRKEKPTITSGSNETQVTISSRMGNNGTIGDIFAASSHSKPREPLPQSFKTSDDQYEGIRDSLPNVAAEEGHASAYHTPQSAANSIVAVVDQPATGSSSSIQGARPSQKQPSLLIERPPQQGSVSAISSHVNRHSSKSSLQLPKSKAFRAYYPWKQKAWTDHWKESKSEPISLMLSMRQNAIMIFTIVHLMSEIPSLMRDLMKLTKTKRSLRTRMIMLIWGFKVRRIQTGRDGSMQEALGGEGRTRLTGNEVIMRRYTELLSG
ncbi:MAG: hypothetical protein Q9166_001790 [cf. Caloplaca sp. 2 TL-2023]